MQMDTEILEGFAASLSVGAQSGSEWRSPPIRDAKNFPFPQKVEIHSYFTGTLWIDPKGQKMFFDYWHHPAFPKLWMSFNSFASGLVGWGW